jgi:peptidyl-tRNA hydrolase, PTH1 family
MFIIVGLGNPGKKYEKTRHNTGFKAIDKITANFAFPQSKFYPSLEAEISEKIIAGKKIVIAKPQTFMNLSGKAVKKLIKKWKIDINNLIVMHDDLDIELGKIKISRNRGPAGHKGVKSIIENIGNKDFCRIRLGIKPNNKKPDNPDKFVLGKFNKKEEEILQEALNDTAIAIEIILQENQEKAANRFN